VLNVLLNSGVPLGVLAAATMPSREVLEILLAEGVGLGILAAMSPGPDTFLIIKTATSSKRAGLQCVGGIALALCIHSCVSLFLIEEVIAHLNKAMVGIQFVGGLYMLWLGLKSINKARNPLPDAPAEESAKIKASAFWHGMFTNLLNPKALAFFIFLVTPFLARAKTVPEGIVLVAGVDVGMLAYFFTLALAVAGIGPLLKRCYQFVEAIVGVLFVIFGISCLILSMKSFWPAQ
jgi:threonine efflux protein